MERWSKAGAEGCAGGEVERKGRGGALVAGRDGGEGKAEQLRFRGKGGRSGVAAEGEEEVLRRSSLVAAEKDEGVGTGSAGEGGAGRETGVAGGLRGEEVEAHEDRKGRRSTRRSPVPVPG